MKVQERKQEHVDSLITEHVIFVINQVKFLKIIKKHSHSVQSKL